MNDEKTTLTHIDAYYKGFHVGLTSSDNTAEGTPISFLSEQAIQDIEIMIKKGYEPSWNKETTKQALAPITPTVAPSTAFENSLNATPMFCGSCGASMTFREGKNKNNQPWKGYFCPNNKEHKPVWVK